jgi:hypothetical protein
MSAADEPSAIGAVSAKIHSIQESVSKVEVVIADVASQIKEVEMKLKTQLNPDDLQYWRAKEGHLRVKKDRLRVEQEQLRAEKKILLQQSGTICAFSL